MLQLEEVFIDNYLEKRIERETILNTYLESYNSISSRIERQRFTSVLGNRMIQCKELVAHHDSVIKGYLFNLKKKIVSYFGVEPKGWEEVQYSLDPINEAVFDENLEGQTDLFFAYLHLFITELKVGVVRDTLKKLKVQYKKLENIARTDANSKEPAFDDLQLIISQSQYCSNAFRRKTLLQNLLDRIGQINYDEDLTATPLSKIVRNHSVQVPTLVKEVANDTAQKSTSNYHSKTIEIYLNQYRKNPNISRSERIEQCISVTDNETVRNEFKAKCGDSTLKRWEDKLDETLEKHERYSGLSG